MKRHGHTIFEVVQQVVRNFFNEEDEEAKKEFQRLMREPGLLNNASGLEDKEQLVSWLKESSRFSSKDGYKKFQAYVKRGRRVRVLRKVRIAASFLLALVLGGAAYWLNVHWEKRNHVELAEEIQPIMSKGYIMLDDGTRIDLGEDKGEVREADGIKITRDSVKVVYASEDVTPTDRIAYNELNVPRGGEYMLVLTDGTKVWVNADSRLKFPQSFSGDTREVYLEGEGFFQVAKDATKPFIVHCEKYAVRVLGTTFNISAYQNDEVSMTTLVEGRVNIECGNTVVALTPGLMAAVADSKVTTREVNVESYISWTRDQFSFSEERLEDLLKKISRWYDVEFVFDDEEIKDYKFSGFMPRYESITNLFEILEQSANVSFVRKEDKKVIIIKH